MNGKAWLIGKSLGVLILSALCLPLLISGVLAEGNETTTTTTSITIPQIDVAPLINLVVALLPAILVIVIIRAVLGSIAGYARLVRIKHKLGGWLSNSKVVKVLPAVLMIAFLCFGFFSGTVAAETSSTTGIDVSAMIDLVMSLLPLIIVLVIVKALMNAFKGLG